MAPKFDMATADVTGLKERVRKLTTAIVKQKEQIEKLRATENQLAGDKEKLERQVRNMQEEAAMSREMRADLQGEIARLQRALDHQSAEADMLRNDMETHVIRPLDISASGNDELTCKLRKDVEDAEARAALLESEMARHRAEANSLSDELEALKDTYDMDSRRWAAGASSNRTLPLGPSPAQAPIKTMGGGDDEGAEGSEGGYTESLGDGEQSATNESSSATRPHEGGEGTAEGVVLDNLGQARADGSGTSEGEHSTPDAGQPEAHATDSTQPAVGVDGEQASRAKVETDKCAPCIAMPLGAHGWHETEIERMKEKVA